MAVRGLALGGADAYADQMIVVLLWWAVCGVIGYVVGETKGRPGQGAVLGALLGPIGWLLVYFGPDYRKKNEPSIVRAVAARADESLRAFAEPKLRIAKDGADIGEIDIPAVKLHIKTGNLTLSDFYYDQSLGDWHPLDVCPALSEFWQGHGGTSESAPDHAPQ